MNVQYADSSENEQILTLLEAGEKDESIRRILLDIRRIGRLLDADSFVPSPLHDHLLSALEHAYGGDLLALYGMRAVHAPPTGSVYLRLEQFKRDLIRIAAMRLMQCGRITPQNSRTSVPAFEPPAKKD